MAGFGKFVTFEGGEGAGKSTQAKRLATVIEARGHRVVITREPGGSATPGAEEIRELLVNGKIGRWGPMPEALLMFAARADHVARTIHPALDAGFWVVCDRFTDSTYAYQGAGRGLSSDTIAKLDAVVLEGFKPDLTIVLDLPANEGLKRAAARGQPRENRFEHFGLDFHERIRSAFREIAAREPKRCVLIDGARGEDAVAADVWRAIEERLHP